MNNSNQITNNKYCHETWFRKEINRDCIQSNLNEYYANSFKYFDEMKINLKMIIRIYFSLILLTFLS